MRTLLAATTALCIVAGACSSSNGGEDAQALARRVALKQSDLPEGWAASERPESNLPPECDAIDRANNLAEEGAFARSPKLSDPSDPVGVRQIDNTVYVFSNAGAASNYFAVYTADTAVNCFETVGDIVATQLGGGLPVSVQQPGVDVEGADQAIEYKIVVGPSGNPAMSFFQNILVVRVGRVVAGFTAQNFGGDFPQGTAALTAVMNRIRNTDRRP